MRKLVIAALVVVGAAISVPANAQDVYFGFGGGSGYGQSYDNAYRDNGYRSYDNGYRRSYEGSRVYGDGGYRRNYRRSYASECRVVRVWAGDHYRRIRRCY